jgi:hypothetical protein
MSERQDPGAVSSNPNWAPSPDGTYLVRTDGAKGTLVKQPWTDPATGTVWAESVVYPDGSRQTVGQRNTNAGAPLYVNADGSRVAAPKDVDSSLYGNVIQPVINKVTGAVTPSNTDTTPLVGALGGAVDMQQFYRGQQDPSRGNTLFNEGQTLIGNLTGAANGAVPSAAEIQTQGLVGRVGAQQFGNASALAGRNPGGALRMATIGASNLQGNAIAAGAAQRATEQANARQTLVGAIGGAQSAENARTGQLISADVAGGAQAIDAANNLVGGNAKNTAAHNTYRGQLIGDLSGRIGHGPSDEDEDK